MPVSKNRRKKPKQPKKTRKAAEVDVAPPPEAPDAEEMDTTAEPAGSGAPEVLEALTAIPEPSAPAMEVIAGGRAAEAVVTRPLAEAVEPATAHDVPPPRPQLTVVQDEPASDSPPLTVEEAAAEFSRMVSEKPAPDTDPFGRDPAFERRALRALEVLYKHYFRVQTKGIENVPSEGPAILVANHSGALPWDGAMLKCALAFDHPSHRNLRPLSENIVFHFPFLGVLFNRFGAVRACQENAEALLDAGEAVAVFPEGVKGLGKLFGKRYQLQRFGRGGFVRLATRTKTPIIPVAIVGAEEAHPLLARVVRPVEPLGIPYVPVTPTFPLLGPLGLMPLPTKWTIEFGEPITVNEAQVSDELAIERLTEDVRSDIQSRIDRLLSQRKTWFT